MSPNATPAVTRFAPSPTGYLHVGGLRSALYNYLWAKQTGGTFHLRIEDTDQARLVEDAEAQITESLQWLGLQWDGEIVHQSERRANHLERALELIKAGKAYVADETAEELAEMRERQRTATAPSYDGTARETGITYDPENPHHVIRFKWPDDPKLSVTFRNEIAAGRKITVSRADAPTIFEDFVLIKADGFPTYNFAHVIDDHEMGITDVIRGDEFVSSAHKYAALYDAYGWDRPRYAFLPPILGPEGTKKLSKRDGAVSALDYRDQGFLPEAVANFLALIGWSPGGDREYFASLEELAETFSLERVQKSPGRFDEQKLRWLNGEHLKQRDAGEVAELAEAAGFWKPSDDAAYDARVLAQAVQGIDTLQELSEVRNGYFYRPPELTADQVCGNQPAADVASWLERVNRGLGVTEDWEADRIQNILTDIREELNLAPKELFPVLREALTGAPRTPAIWDLMMVLGRDESLARLEAAEALVT